MDQHPYHTAHHPEQHNFSAQQIIDAANQMLVDTASPAVEPLNEALFIIKPASYWMEQAANRPPQQMLFDGFWFDGEICILFADTNLGKSILAVQIGTSISEGNAIPGFALQAPAQPILYFDFELTDKQFRNRYSADSGEPYPFNANFLRIEINPDAALPDELPFEDYLSQCIEQAVVSQQARVLIIDNLTYLRNETEKAKDALPLMKHLKVLKNRHNLSILVLAHTPKRDASKPITRNDLSGSKMLINFCDSAFAIGESFKDGNLRYLKQIKQRNTEQLYGADNVCICQVSKATNFVRFELIAHDNEHSHLKERTEKDQDEQTQRLISLKQQGLTMREIGEQLGISHTMVNKRLKKLETL